MNEAWTALRFVRTQMAYSPRNNGPDSVHKRWLPIEDYFRTPHGLV